jgi:hypothetical protein
MVLVGVQNAGAQITGTVEFTTSFPFTVGNATMPAGSYTIRPDDDNSQILELTGAGTSVLFQTDSVQAPDTPSKTEVVFNRHGQRYVLKDIWLEGSNIGAEAVPVEAERHAAKNRGSEGDQRVAARRKADAAKGR